MAPVLRGAGVLRCADVPRGDLVRRETLRVAWLMVGAAIGLAAVLLLTGLAQVVGPRSGWAEVAVTVALLLPVGLLGLLPGVRDLEVTAARTLLGVRTELLLPEHPIAAHRRRTVLTVLVHLGLGLVVGVLLVGGLAGLVASVSGWVRDEPVQLLGWSFAPLPTALAAPVTLLGVALVLLIASALGRLAAWSVARLLGPTAEDRLEVALARLEAEAAHTRLARELHDGIGHALTIIGLQAAAGRRVLGTDPARTEEALGTIEATSSGALAELDEMLGTLRSGAVVRETAPGLDRLDVLLGTYRGAGMEIISEVDPLPWLPPLTSATAQHVVAEALTNAARHAGPGPIRLRISSSPTALRLRVVSPLPTGRLDQPNVRGLGLTGVAEQVRLLGGTSSAGPEATSWALTAELPMSARRG